MEMNEQINFRTNKDTIRLIKEIIKAKPELYPSKSQVFRSAVFYLYNKEVKK